MAENIKTLIQKPGSLKVKITNVRKFLNERKNSDVSVENITRWLEKWNKLLKPFDELSDELSYILDDTKAEAYVTPRC